MSDSTNLTMHVTSASDEIRDLARNAFEEYSGGVMHYEDETNENTLTIGANECRCGSADELHASLLAIVAEYEQDFAWYVYEDPAYEWLGDVRVHVPGFEDFQAECDSDGQPVLSAMKLKNILAGGDDVRTEIEIAMGKPQIEAWGKYTGDATVASPVSTANDEKGTNDEG